MGSIVDKLIKRQLITPPTFIKNNTHYEVIMGSVAYGVSSDMSDTDVYGFCIPPKHIIFPHLSGEIFGFGNQVERFKNYQKHHVKDVSSGREYDLDIYSIIHYFQLCMQNNPNMIDSLFVPRRCVVHSTQIGELVRENRKLFLHKGCWHRFKGYAYSQMSKMKTKKPDEDSKRYWMIEKYGFDVKFASHVVRLLNEVEQIMIEGDLDLQRNREQLKSVRNGEWTQEQIIEYFDSKEKELEGVYSRCELPWGPDEDKIKTLLLECLEMHYGSLSDAVKLDVPIEQILNDMSDYIEKLRRMIK